MKRCFVLFLALALLLPCFALADTEQELIGVWVGGSEPYRGEVDYFILRLFDDHSAIYSSGGVDIWDAEGFQLVNKATWELKEDGVHVSYRNYWNNDQQDDFVLELTQSHHLARLVGVSYIIFTKLPDRRAIGSFHTVKDWD